MPRADLLTVIYHDDTVDTFSDVRYWITPSGLHVLADDGRETTVDRHHILTTRAYTQSTDTGAALMTTSNPDHLRAVLDEVAAERGLQDAKWGEQNHPGLDPVLRGRPGGCTPQRMAAEYGVPSAVVARTACERAATRGDLTWGHIAVEELAEAVEAGTVHGDGGRLRDELVQTAAVLIAWIQYLDRAAGADNMTVRVSDELRPWAMPWPGYRPADVTPAALRPGSGLQVSVAAGWAEPAADPAEVDDWQTRRHLALVPFDLDGGRPRNPAGRTGRIGRRLGKWGENTAADAAVVVGAPADRAGWQILLVNRGDCGQWALPGGMVEAGESLYEAAVRELREETGLDLAGHPGELVRRGHVPDPRATDWAWVCSAVTLFRLPEPVPVAGADDAADADWWPFADLDTLVRALRAAGGELYQAHYVLLCAVHLGLQQHAREATGRSS